MTRREKIAWAKERGVNPDHAYKLNIEQMQAMGEEARALMLGMVGRGFERGCDPKRFDRGGLVGRFPTQQNPELPMDGGMYRGASVADWMEEFARSEMLELKPRPAVRRHAGREPAHKPVVKMSAPPDRSLGAPWVSFGDWTDEAGPRVRRMIQLAAGRMVA
jgi:hypothetical protein